MGMYYMFYRASAEQCARVVADRSTMHALLSLLYERESQEEEVRSSEWALIRAGLRERITNEQRKILLKRRDELPTLNHEMLDSDDSSRFPSTQRGTWIAEDEATVYQPAEVDGLIADLQAFNSRTRFEDEHPLVAFLRKSKAQGLGIVQILR